MQFLSYILNTDTPSYGNRNKFSVHKKSDISNGDVANDSCIETTVHMGTHIDMPYHFYEEGQTVEDFDDDFWIFNNFLIVELHPKKLIINDELIRKIESFKSHQVELLIIKTQICHRRDEESFWKENYGFHPDIYDYLIKYFPNVRVMGFDSISVSSFNQRLIGREAHKRFLNPKKPILLLEDMDLRSVTKDTHFDKVMILPLRIAKCDGLPCTVIGLNND